MGYIGLENKKILIVEDVELNQFLVRRILESWGCLVEVVENGALALESLNRKNFDLVLMDIQMPVMDGIEATKEIRKLKDPVKATIPIIALTANAIRGNCTDFIKAGMNDCLQKPFEEDALFEIISENIKINKAISMNVLPECADKMAVPALKMYDLSMVETISGGDKTFVVKMLQLFLDNVPVSLKEMSAASGKKDWAELSRLAHKLKSTIDSMGIAEVQQTIRVMESNGKSGNNAEALPALVGQVVETMEAVMAQVRKDHSL